MRKSSSKQRMPNPKLIFLFAAGFILFGVLCALCLPLFQKLAEPQTQKQIEQWISSLGFEGWLIVLAIQMLQIIIAFLPGEPVELLAGVLYGAWGGLLTCLLGILLASSAVFFTVRRFGYPLVVKIFGKEKLSEFRFLNDNDKIETLTFILFLLPGTPKDMLTYLAGVSKIRPMTFLLLSTFARIPSIITSTMMGSSVSQGRIGMAIVTFLLTAAIGILGIFYKNRLFHRLHGKDIC